ncbi:electron transport complex subunit RsxD [Candidatus Erwinia haradaeae]|uniref:Ion-translocating oxidoreductase complex subunit D n=1 Tax=Candidatus Erwinia haradaeae TaxID=1922217 RepID=A0A451D2S3_9GAMM|nr:electron transport complex subunit RsxD [Candidatus Erwinia haradaeae]VFP79966.1 Electron transport complex subunit RsxD [Candidatus Erwinia haradaeae]
MSVCITTCRRWNKNHNTNRIMLLVLIATIPGLIAQYYLCGWGNLIQIFISISVALIAESIILCLRHYPILNTLQDNSALLTAVLLGVSIPALSPWWVITIGTLFAIIIAKQLYGGLGNNPFNPAMAAYIMLLISFPVQMTTWCSLYGLKNIQPSLSRTLEIIIHPKTQTNLIQTKKKSIYIDSITQATPLDHFKTSLHEGFSTNQILAQPIYNIMSINNPSWQCINASFLLGGIFLLITRIIRWHIPLAFLTSLTICSSIGWFFSSDHLLPPLVHLFSGSTMLGAFFIATDPVTSATTNHGRLIYAALIGFLTWLIRSYGGYPDGLAFAVLLANMCAPIIDYYTKPRVFGHYPKRII